MGVEPCVLPVAIVPKSRRRNKNMAVGETPSSPYVVWRGQVRHRFVLSHVRCYRIGEGRHLKPATAPTTYIPLGSNPLHSTVFVGD